MVLCLKYEELVHMKLMCFVAIFPVSQIVVLHKTEICRM